MRHTNILKLFKEFTQTTKVYRDKLNTVDSGMFLCDIHTFEEQILKQLNEGYVTKDNNKNGCLEHGYIYPCPVCDGESDF
jgi:hypothetical protein